MATRATHHGTTPWWRDAAAYEIYLRSFADADGDGVGDLRGVHDRLEHLAWLGVDLIWITPFYPSPMADHGYDVADHMAVDPRYGSLADLDALVGRAHELGMRVLIDLVPNHTSDRHPWFQASRADPDGPHRSWYRWHDPGTDGGPPNNWLSYFGGPAWSYDAASGQWWGHMFLPEQPDLRWEEPAVAAAFDEILRFWLARGVDGFRIDVAQGLAKDPSLADNPPAPDAPTGEGTRQRWASQQHLHDIAQPQALDIFRRWNRVVAPHEALLLGEVYLEDTAEIARYLAGDGLHLAFTIAFTSLPWDAEALRGALAHTWEHLGEGACWTQTSHDEQRPPTRYGGGERGRQRSLAVTTLLAGMPGPLMLYQGEELGLEDGAVAPSAMQDPAGERDGCRTPLPWEPGPGWGFTSAPEPWLPFGDRRPADTAAVQRGDERSPLHRYRRLLEVRRDLDPASPPSWLGRGAVVAYQRGDHLIAAAVDDVARKLDLPPGAWRIAFSTDPDRAEGAVEAATLELAPAEAVILARGDGGR